jgi:hypothetical protein
MSIWQSLKHGIETMSAKFPWVSAVDELLILEGWEMGKQFALGIMGYFVNPPFRHAGQRKYQKWQEVFDTAHTVEAQQNAARDSDLADG